MERSTAGSVSPSDMIRDMESYSIRNIGLLFKRNPRASSSDDDLGRGGRRRSLHSHRRSGKRGVPFRGRMILYVMVSVAIIACFAMQSSIMAVFSLILRERPRWDDKLLTKAMWFNQWKLWSKFPKQGRIRQVMSEKRTGIRQPRLAVVMGSMKKDPSFLLFLTVMKRLHSLGYKPTIYSTEDGEAYQLWKEAGYSIFIFGPEGASHVDWSMFEGVILSSLQAKGVISSLMQDPFSSVPVIWTIMEDTLGKRLPVYAMLGWEDLLNEWRDAFGRADVVVFPDFSLPMLYSMLDTGNFFVIPGSPVDVWAAESYFRSHSKYHLRADNGFQADDLIVIVGSSLFYGELPWGYAVVLHTIGLLLMKLKGTQVHERETFAFIFLSGNFTDDSHHVLQGIASQIGLPEYSVRQYSMDGDMNSVLLMADIILYGNFQEEQGFPNLLLRAMSFGVPVVAPDLAIIKKYIVDGIHGLIFRRHNPYSLAQSFSCLLSGMKISKFAHIIGSAGKLLAQNLMASECVVGYARMLENVLQFPSNSLLPGPVSQFEQHTWDWSLLGQITSHPEAKTQISQSKIVNELEMELNQKNVSKNNLLEKEFDTQNDDTLTHMDWDDLREIEDSEEFERRELEELEERTERTLGLWEAIYHTARKSEKINSEANERDEGELERTGQLLCIYEIYSGRGAWPFLNHRSLYRGLSLSTEGQRSRTDDVDAVSLLPLLNNSYWKNILCELGAMFSITVKFDKICKTPWIGFQSWRIGGMKFALSVKAEKKLVETLQNESNDAIYYWVRTDMDPRVQDSTPDFWSLCDTLNAGFCRELFANAFQQMYNIPQRMDALPTMPVDRDHWSTLHGWVMPTSSFQEFIMFSRMFVDSLDAANNNVSMGNHCILGSSGPEKKHCYCRILELLVNVWAYHTARKMVYISPGSGDMIVQHPIEQRKGKMWMKYFSPTLLKEMDEDLAEAADDGDNLRERWLWPLTGEVHWQGMYENDREERYRQKMDKKRKTKEKLLERQKYGYKQKTLGGL